MVANLDLVKEFMETFSYTHALVLKSSFLRAYFSYTHRGGDTTVSSLPHPSACAIEATTLEQAQKMTDVDKCRLVGLNLLYAALVNEVVIEDIRIGTYSNLPFIERSRKMMNTEVAALPFSCFVCPSVVKKVLACLVDLQSRSVTFEAAAQVSVDNSLQNDTTSEVCTSQVDPLCFVLHPLQVLGRFLHDYTHGGKGKQTTVYPTKMVEEVENVVFDCLKHLHASGEIVRWIRVVDKVRKQLRLFLSVPHNTLDLPFALEISPCNLLILTAWDANTFSHPVFRSDESRVWRNREGLRASSL